ncbi:MAG: peptidoglycan-binding protein [Christensenellales bacterium]
MRYPEYRDKNDRRISRLRAKYRRRTALVFFMALVLGFLLGWILFGIVNGSAGDRSSQPAQPTPAPDAIATPTPTPWADETPEPEPTEAPTPEPTAEVAEITAPPADPTEAPVAQETPAPLVLGRGSKDDPILIGEPYSFTAQLREDGTPASDTAEAAHHQLPVTMTVERHLTPEYYYENYSTQYNIKGNEAGAQINIELGAVEGLSEVSMQDAILVMFENEQGDVQQGFKFTDGEIGAQSNSEIATGAADAIYKRYNYGDVPDISYLTLTYYEGGFPVTVYFSLTDSILPEEPASAPEATQAPAEDGDAYQTGDEGEGVLKLQQKLIELGYLSGTADGKYGKWTEAAVMAAQKDLGMAQTGVADAAFIQALNER